MWFCKKSKIKSKSREKIQNVVEWENPKYDLDFLFGLFALSQNCNPGPQDAGEGDEQKQKHIPMTPPDEDNASITVSVDTERFLIVISFPKASWWMVCGIL